MKAITAKYTGATNSRPARIIVHAEGLKSLSYGYHDLDGDVFVSAVQCFCASHGWSGTLHHGVLPRNIHVFVFAQDQPTLV